MFITVNNTHFKVALHCMIFSLVIWSWVEIGGLKSHNVACSSKASLVPW